MKLLRLGLASSVVLSLVVFSHGCANNSDDCAYTADCKVGAADGGSGSGGSSPTGGASNSGGDAGTDGSGGTSASGGSSSGGSGGTGESCDATGSPSEEPCLLTDEHGVFVSPLGDPEGGDGTRENPFASVNEAILAAKAAGKLVIACATEGAFEEPLQIGESGDGTRLYGGFSCSDWSYTAEVRTLVQSPTSTGLRVQDLVDGLTIEDFEIVASDGKQPGESSMGAFVTNSVNVTFKRVSLTAGDGADGADGEGTSTKAESGADGNPGTNACSGEETNPGGVQVQTICNEVPSGSFGGRGGRGEDSMDSPGNGGAGLPQLGGGTSGVGQLGSTYDCIANNGNGVGGVNGESKPTAAGAQGFGRLLAAGYVSVAGGSGENGTVGQGGGGGGGAKAPVSCGEGKPLTGASGGSGGGGGCGGKGGQGGKGGGASFALASVNSSISLSAVVLSAGKGGDGGKGGHGQPGGDGGARGGDADGSSSPKSCEGGRGGQGGNGGHGGGGIGGPSVGIAYVGEEPVQKNVEIMVAPVPAQGGLDGGGQMTGAGEAGLVAKKQEFPSN